MKLRPARSGEGQVLFDITKAAIEAGGAGVYAPDALARWMVGRDAQSYEHVIAQGTVLVADGEAGPVGFIEALPGVIERLFVAPRAMGKGVGRALLEAGLAVAGGGGGVELNATLNAVEFYKKSGFREIARVEYTNEAAGLTVQVVKMAWERRETP